MNTYKNLEIYQMAFNLAIKVYRLNITLPVHALLNQGNKLRWSSLKIKDLIAEGFSGNKQEEHIEKVLLQVKTLNEEVISLLKKIKSGNPDNKQIHDLIKNYYVLKRKTDEIIRSLNRENSDYIIPFKESTFMEMA